MVRSMLPVALLSASAHAADEYAFVGSGGCAGYMEGCVDDVVYEELTQQIQIHPDGGLESVHFGDDNEGLPVWLAGADSVIGLKCIFAALADKDQVRPTLDLVPGIPTQVTPSVATGGANPVHMTVTPDQKFLLVANYNGPDNSTSSEGAGVSSLAITQEMGGCGLELRDFVPHAGSGPDKTRQGAAHVHSIQASRDGKFAYACDLGQDLIFSYSIAEDGKLTELSRTKTAPGSGPRHLVEHPTMDFIYSVQEMEQTVSAYQKGENGALKLQQTLSLIPEGASHEGSFAAEILILPDGSSLYVSNRGKLNTVTVFSVADDGSLAQTQQIDAPRSPRGMALAHGASLLIIASQEDSTIESFSIGSDGQLTSTGHVLDNLDKGLPDHPATLLVVPPSNVLVAV